MKSKLILIITLLFTNNALVFSKNKAKPQYPSYFTGAIVPLVTPYQGNLAERIDVKAMYDLVDYLCTTRASALFVVSGTGQWPLLSMDEKKELILTAIQASAHRKPILAGVGSVNNIDEEIQLAKYSETNGANAIVAVTPVFIREQQQFTNGEKRIIDQTLLMTYYTTLATAVKIPLIIYDPEAEVSASTLSQLTKQCPNIKGIKYREKKIMGKFQELAQAVDGRAAILSGSEIYALGAMKEGAVGFIGNGLNLYPNLGDDFSKAVFARNWIKAEKLQNQIIEANGHMENLGGGAQGIKKILNDVIGVPMATANRGDQFKPESFPGEHEKILTYYRNMDLPRYSPSRRK